MMLQPFSGVVVLAPGCEDAQAQRVAKHVLYKCNSGPVDNTQVGLIDCREPNMEYHISQVAADLISHDALPYAANQSATF